MDQFIRNPGFQHIAVQIFDQLDSKSLQYSLLVSKDWNQFVKYHFQRDIWIRALSELEIIRKHDNSYGVPRPQLEILFVYYCENSTLKDLKTLVHFAKKYRQELTHWIKAAFEDAIENNHIAFFNLFVNSPLGLEIYFNKLQARTELYFATKVETFKFFIDHGQTLWNINLTEPIARNENILHLAISKRNVEAIQLVLDSVNIDVNNGYLHYACKEGSYEVVKHLLKLENIDVNRVFDGEPPLQVAYDEKLYPIVKLLLQHRDTNVTPLMYWDSIDKEGNTILHYLIENGNIDAIKRLLEHENIDINDPDHE